MNPVLVVGYGNTLRGDDGAGVVAAERAGEGVRGIDVIVTHQLQPEIAEQVAYHRCVIFLDASVLATELTVRELPHAARPGGTTGHVQRPEFILALARDAYGRSPEKALLIEIPARSMEFGEPPTPATEAGIRQAIEHVRRTAQDYLQFV